MIGNEMTQAQSINQNTAFRKLMDEKKSEIEAVTKKFVDSEMAIFEFKLCAASLGDAHLSKANQDTLDFTRETMAKAKSLQEYKRLVNFV